MQFALPGTVEEKPSPPHVARRPQIIVQTQDCENNGNANIYNVEDLPYRKSNKLCLPPISATTKTHKIGSDSLHTDIWEYIDQKWEVTHMFNTGLELDLKAQLPSGVTASRVHLPSASLRGFQQLRALLRTPGAIALDIKGNGKTSAEGVFNALLFQVASFITPASLNEARIALAERTPDMDQQILPNAVSPETSVEMQQSIDDDTQSTCSENLVQADIGTETVDVSVCPLQSMDPFATSQVVFARIHKAEKVLSPRTAETPVRYAVLIVCPAGNAKSIEVARETGCALASTLMDDAFAHTVRTALPGHSASILAALDVYMSTVTIVPTVYMHKPSDNCTTPATSRTKAILDDEVLADKIVSTMENLVCRSRGLHMKHDLISKLHHAPLQCFPHKMERHKSFYVEVSEKSPSRRWRVTHELHQGLELDVAMHSAKLHLPRVSLLALADARRLMTTASIGLEMQASSSNELLDVVMYQLSHAGLPLDAIDEMRVALAEKMVSAPSQELDLPQDKLIKPQLGDETCQLLVVATQSIPKSSGAIGAFLTFRTPCRCCQHPNGAPVRFLMVFAGPASAENDLAKLGDSIAALATDEDLMASLSASKNTSSFLDAVDKRLNHLAVLPHARFTPNYTCNEPEVSPEQEHRKSSGRNSDGSIPKLDEEGGPENGHSEHVLGTPQSTLRKIVKTMQKYSLPLIFGVLSALIWSNINYKSYHDVIDSSLLGNFKFLDHTISLHFLVNDVFMVFFFGLAIKEVTEAVLPGGSLSPLRRAVNPLVATCGGVVGPAAVYVVLVLILYPLGGFDGTTCEPLPSKGGHRRLGGSAGGTEPCSLSILLKGWGIPTATDISLAWMFAILIFGAGHPAINFLLLLAIVDDALGMAIIAIFYSDNVKPEYLLLVLGAAIMACAMRCLRVPRWQVYVFICGPVAWLGLLLAKVHPALALVAVVPFMPASEALIARKSGGWDLGAVNWDQHHEEASLVAKHFAVSIKRRNTSARLAATLLAMYRAEHAPLHVFEHSMKLPVDMGMFFFGLANAGVKLDSVGGVTVSVLGALVVGKTLGIAGFGLLASCCGFGLPAGVTIVDLFAMSALAGVGLTVALFVANEAFVHQGPQSQAKFGAVLSVACAGLAWAIKQLGRKSNATDNEACPLSEHREGIEADLAVRRSDTESDPDWMDDYLVDEIMQILWLRRKYSARSVALPVANLARASLEAENVRSRSKRSTISVESVQSDRGRIESTGPGTESVVSLC